MKKKETSGERLKFKALITECRWYSDETHWGIFSFTTPDNVSHKLLEEDFFSSNKKSGEIVGNVQKLEVGNEYTLEVEVEYNKKYRKDQFKPIRASMELPTSKDQQERFLNSILTKNQTDSLLSIYPNIVQDVIDKKEIDVTELKGIGESSISLIKQKIVDNYILIDLLSMLSPYGITYKQIKKISELDDNPILVKEMIDENPYVLTRIKGFGFKKVDGIALKLNKKMKISKFRAIEYIRYLLEDESDSVGHTWVKRDYLISKARKDINECMDLVKLTLEEEESNPKFLKVDGDRIGLLVNYNTEKAIYRELERINNNDSIIQLPDSDEINRIIELTEERQGFKLSDEQRKTVEGIVGSGNIIVISGISGCVDSETEYFSGDRWIKISEYKEGDGVLQFNPEDRRAEIVNPLEYHKYPENTMYRMKNFGGTVDQILSLEHNVAYVTSRGNIRKKQLSDIILQHNNDRLGFKGKFINAFDYSGTGVDMSDEMIRVMVSVFADGSYYYHLGEHAPTYTKCRFHIKKERKKERLRLLFSNANLEWEEKTSATDGYTDFYIYTPYRAKSFPKEWYNASKKQLEIIFDEIMYWDGNFGQKGRKSFSTTIKDDADFVQFVASSLGYTANISTYDRTGQSYLTNGKMYTRKSIEYEVHFSQKKWRLSSIVGNGDGKLVNIEPVENTEGYKYCFTVPSGYLVLRRNGNIFITGNSGKSTSIKTLYSILEKSKVGKYDLTPSILQVALSAKAAKRINEVTNRPSMTMHRALKFDGKEFTHNEENPLPNDIVVLDEFSMVNVQLTLSLLKAVKNGAMLFLVFDHAQLPAIGAGSVAYDLLEYPKYNTSRYIQVHRQAQSSGILSDGNTIRKNKSPIKQYDKSITTGELKDMTYFFRKSQEEINNLAIKYYLSGVEKYGVDNINIITARKDKVLNSAELINKVIQDKINPQIEGQYIMNNYKTIDFRLNDRVIHKVNDRERDVYNGDTGVVVEIGRDYVGDSMQDIMIVDYGMEYNDDGKELGRKLVQYTKSDLDDLRLSYAGTVHSWQGSENKAIIVVLDSSAYVLLDSTMLYTAITRAKERCLLITDVNSFKTCIRENKTIIRNTYLKEFLKEGMNG